MRLATETLRRGGTFITKVFRSKDYNALMYVANQLFSKVESNKPQSSRNTSAEIFMVCQGFKAPDYIDPKLLDPKYALEEVEEDNGNQNGDKITSLKKLLTEKRNRKGYEKEALFAECDLMDFLKSSNPHEYLSGFNKFLISPEARTALDKIQKLPSDLEEMCKDIKVCGRRELSELLKIRYKYNNILEAEAKAIKEANRPAPAEKTQDDLQAEVDRELQETIDRVEKMKKRQQKKERERDLKQDIRKKMSVIAATSINNDDELMLDAKTWDKLKQIDVEEVDKYLSEESSSEEEGGVGMSNKNRKLEFKDEMEQKKIRQQEGQSASENESDDSDDSTVARIDKMANEMEEAHRQRKEFHMQVDKKEARKLIKNQALVEL